MKTWLLSLLTSLCLIGAQTALAAAEKVLIVVTSHAQMGNTDEKTGLWLAEATHPHAVLKEAGYAIDFASIQGGAAPIDPRSLEDLDAVSQAFLDTPESSAQLQNTLKLDEVDASAYAAILFAGGHGTVWDFPDSPAVNRIASAIYANDGIIAAVCHGSAALLNIRDSNGLPLIANRQVAGFSNAEEVAIGLDQVVPYLLQDRLEASGARYIEGAAFTTHVVADDRLITGQNPQSAHAVGEAMLRRLQQH
jgi:putative intracellular protease/amidase